MKFTKMQGAGNDYVYINCFEETVDDPVALAIRLSERHFGIGSDGVILICPSEVADCRMRMFNLDGSEGNMCGNGIRCVGKYVHDRGICDKTVLSVETRAGIKILHLNVIDGKTVSVRVDMGIPSTKCADIPVIHDGEEFIKAPVNVNGKDWYLTCVSIGNPHAVTYVESVSDLKIEEIGPLLEKSNIFPERANIEFIEKVSDGTIKMRVWERGSGETLACGTGACASVAASVINGVCSRKTSVVLLGGTLEIEWNEDDGHIYMTGPAEFVFDGELC